MAARDQARRPAECRWLGGPMSRWEELKMLLLALAMSVALAAAGALLAIGLAHLWEAATNETARTSFCFSRLGAASTLQRSRGIPHTRHPSRCTSVPPDPTLSWHTSCRRRRREAEFEAELKKAPVVRPGPSRKHPNLGIKGALDAPILSQRTNQARRGSRFMPQVT